MGGGNAHATEKSADLEFFAGLPDGIVPMLLVSFLVSGQTIRRMEENSYHAIQDRVNRASKDL